VTKKGLFAQEKLPEPRSIEVWSVMPNMGILGKEFKNKSKLIKEYLDLLSQDQIKQLDVQLKSGSVKIKIEGEEIELKSDVIQVKMQVKKTDVEEYTPAVIEPSFGIGRILYSLLEHSIWQREEDEQRVVLSFKPKIAPIKCLLAPLSNKTEFDPLLEEISEEFRKHEIAYKIDDSSTAIGRRYARADELGIPFAVVVDFQSVKDRTVTIRERDTTVPQVRVPVNELAPLMQRLCVESDKWANILAKYPHHTVQDV
jgi:glycyl-tRNA synthetase